MNTKDNQSNKGITLIALVISIIVLLILSAVSINAAIGDNGIITRAIASKEEQDKASAEFEVTSALSSLKYYEYAEGGDYGKNLGKIYSIANLQSLVKGRINYVRVNKATGEKLIYYTENNKSYTIKINAQGKATTKAGIYIFKNTENIMNMDVDENITLTSLDEEYTYWEIDDSSTDIIKLEDNGPVAVFTKVAAGQAIINTYKSVEEKNSGVAPIKIKIKDITFTPVATEISLNEGVFGEEITPDPETVVDTNPAEDNVVTSDIYVYYYGDIHTLAFSHNTQGIDGHTITDSWNNHDDSFIFDMYDYESSLWYDYLDDIQNVVIINKVYPTSTSCWFQSCKNLTSITGLDRIITDNVTNMEEMFYECEKLESLDLSSFNTSNVTSLSGLFSGCTNLKSVDVSSFDTTKVTDMSRLFQNCTSIRNINLSNFTTTNLFNANNMFDSCTLDSLNLSSFGETNLHFTNYMFLYAKIDNLDLSNFDTSELISMEGMFDGFKSESLELNNLDTRKVVNMKYLFYNASNLKYIHVGPNWRQATQQYQNMFTGCGCSSVSY